MGRRGGDRRRLKAQISTYLFIDQIAEMEVLHKRTRVPKADLYREAVEDLLKKYSLVKDG